MAVLSEHVPDFTNSRSMKISKISVILLFLAFLYGCGEQDGVFAGKSRYGLEFKQECRFPAGNPLLQLSGGSSVQIIDTLLLVQHQYENPSFYWEVYGLNSLQHLKSILRHGRGPLEVLFAHYAGQHEMIDNENWMFFFDANSARFLKINLNRSIRSGIDDIELVSSVDAEKIPCFALSDDLLLYRDYNPDDGSVNLMKSDNSWKTPILVKNIYKHITSDDYGKLAHSLYYNKKNRKVCVVPCYVDQIQIIDLEGKDDMILSTAKSNDWQTIRRQDFSESTVFYASTRITDDYLFALYANRKIAEMGNIPDEVEIHVFNWDGDAVAKLRFEDNITSFAVDMKNRVLYGVDDSERLYAYDFGSAIE